MIGISKLCCGTPSPSDALRYASSHRKPVVVWNCTRACNLRCRHCYAAVSSSAPELSGAEARTMIDDLAAFGCPVLLFSGGEPCLRSDLADLAAYARARGLRTVLSTNGTLLTRDLCAALAEAGLAYAGVSIDGLRATHDRFRGEAGAFEAALAGLRTARTAGLRTGLRLTLTRANAPEIPALFEMMRSEGIGRACFYHLVSAGRGGALAAEDLTGAERREAVRRIIAETRAWCGQGGAPEILTVDNPADGPFVYLELLKEDSARAARALELLKRMGGNSSGCGIGCISWDGEVYADQFWRTYSFGNLRARPFSEIWSDTTGRTPQSARLAQLRERGLHLKGRCAACRWREICGGLRVRAEAATGDAWGEDPSCYLTLEECR